MGHYFAPYFVDFIFFYHIRYLYSSKMINGKGKMASLI